MFLESKFQKQPVFEITAQLYNNYRKLSLFFGKKVYISGFWLYEIDFCFMKGLSSRF